MRSSIPNVESYVNQKTARVFTDIFLVRISGYDGFVPYENGQFEGGGQMSTVRVHKDERYFVASNEPFNDGRLSWEARGVMGYLLSKPDGWECRSYDLINQTKAGRHVIKRVMAELQEAGYVYRFRKSEGRNKIKWITEVYESPSMNSHLVSKAENCTIENEGVSKAEIYEVEKFEVEKFEVEKPVDIVNTDSSKYLLAENTEDSVADATEKFSFLSEKVDVVREYIKNLSEEDDLNEVLEAEQSGKNRKGVVKFIEAQLNGDAPAGQEWGEMFKALADCCEYDTSILTGKDRGQLASAAKTMLENGYSPDDIQSFRKWWDRETWQGQKHQPPQLCNVRETWGSYKKSLNGHQNGTTAKAPPDPNKIKRPPNLTDLQWENYQRLVKAQLERDTEYEKRGEANANA